MRYFIQTRKTIVYASVQMCQAVATYLRKGKTSGVIRVRGMSMYPSGFGWYRIYGDVASKGSDILAALNFLAVRIKNMALKRVVAVEESKPEMFAFTEGFFSTEILHLPRVLKVRYDTVRGHRVPKVVNRALQASEGMREYLSESLSRLAASSLNQNKLNALVAKFSH